MNYFFDCPYCSQSFEVEAELAGLNCVCTGCGEVFVVPSPPKMAVEVASPRLDDLDDMRPEVWLPDAEEPVPLKELQPDAEPNPLSTQYAGEALVGDEVVPVNFVPTGMETLSEVYGMIPEPENHSTNSQIQPAEVRVRRVTPMMIEGSGMQHPNAQMGIVKARQSAAQNAGDQLGRPSSGALKYTVLGLVAGILMAWGGLRLSKNFSATQSAALSQGGNTAPVGGQNDGAKTVPNDEEGIGLIKRFPDNFMGIKFGAKIEYIPDRATWAKEGDNLHKPAFLADERVQAVLIPDHDGRLTVGAYVRIAEKSDGELVAFLEWALTVQDAVTSKFGKPSSVHVVKNAATETEIVRKILSGEDFYECVWVDPLNQCMITASVAGRNSRLVVFRLEYKSIPLTNSYLKRKLAQ